MSEETRRRFVSVACLVFAALAVGAILFSMSLSQQGKKAMPEIEKSAALYHPSLPYILNGKDITLERVTSSAAMAQGLGDRPEIAPDHGMLFIYPAADIRPFWMRHMRFPIDIIWIENGIVVDVASHLPPPKNAWDVPVTYTPKGVASWVLEVAAGQAEAYELRPGSTVTLIPIP